MTDSKKWLILAALLTTGVLFYLLAPVLTPFLVAALLSYLGNPLVARMERRLGRTGAVSVVFVAFFGAIVAAVAVLLPLIEREWIAAMDSMPQYIDKVQTKLLPWLASTLGAGELTLDLAALKDAIREHWQQAGGIASNVVRAVSASGLALMGGLANLVLIPVITFYLLRDWSTFIERVHELIPRAVEPVIAKLATEADIVLGAFLRGQVTVMVVLGAVYAAGLWLIGLNFALLIGILAGLVSFVPYLGVMLGVTAASAVALVQFPDYGPLFLVLLVFGVGQVLESFILTPFLVGDKIGLHPVAVVFAIAAGGELFGFFGILLALPVAAVILVILRQIRTTYFGSSLYSPRK